MSRLLYEHLESVDTDCENVLWFKLNKALFQTEEDFYFVTVYVQPAYIGYSQTDILEQFYHLLDSFARSYKFVYLLGDNARAPTPSEQRQIMKYLDILGQIQSQIMCQIL